MLFLLLILHLFCIILLDSLNELGATAIVGGNARNTHIAFGKSQMADLRRPQRGALACSHEWRARLPFTLPIARLHAE